MQSETQISALSTQWAQTHAPKGCVVNAANGGLVKAYLDSKGLEVSLENLTLAVNQLAGSLEWETGSGPVPAAKPLTKRSAAQQKADAEQKLLDNGIRPSRRQDHSDTGESPYAREVRENLSAMAAKVKEKERAEARWRAENEVVYVNAGRPRAGAVDHSSTEKMRRQAKLRHAAEDRSKAA